MVEPRLTYDAELCSIVDLANDSHCGSIDRSIAPTDSSSANSMPVIEFKDVALAALWSATHDASPSSDDLVALREELARAPAEDLLLRKFTAVNSVSKTIQSLEDDTAEQLGPVASQEGRIKMGPGIYDNRVSS